MKTDIRDSLKPLPSPFEEGLRSIYRSLTELNYRLRLFSTHHDVEGVHFCTYDLVDMYRNDDGDRLLQLMLEKCASEDVIYDIGASSGLYTLTLLSEISDSQVVAFEPNPRTSSRLQSNLELNEIEERCYLQRIGLGNSDMEKTLYMSRNPNVNFSADGGSSFKKENAFRGSFKPVGKADRSVRRLDTFFSDQKVPPPDHIKIDVEGKGPDVIEGAEEIIREHRPKIYYEPHRDENGSYRRRKVESMLKDLNYDMKEYDRYWIMTP
jgi:FkbM family methyltransferase